MKRHLNIIRLERCKQPPVNFPAYLLPNSSFAITPVVVASVSVLAHINTGTRSSVASCIPAIVLVPCHAVLLPCTRIVLDEVDGDVFPVVVVRSGRTGARVLSAIPKPPDNLKKFRPYHHH